MKHARPTGARGLVPALALGLVAFAGLAGIAPRAHAASEAPAVDREKLPGAKVYRERCAQCHEGQAAKAPSRVFINLMTPESIHETLAHGIMQIQATGLSDDDKKNVAEYLSGIPVGAPRPPEAPRCTAAAANFDLAKPPRTAGWGITPDNNHFVAGDAARLSAADLPRLKLKWAFAYPNSQRARSRPTFGYGALYTGSHDGTVYALDAKTGCVRFTYKTSAEVRTGVLLQPGTGPKGKNGGNHPAAYFGDIIGRVYAIDALTGKELWRTRVDDHPSATITGTPVFHGGRVYVAVSSLEEAASDKTYPCCTFRGSVVALDAATGKQVWKTYAIDETPKDVGVTKAGTKIWSPSGAAIWNTPTLDTKRGLLYVGTGNNYTGPANARSNAVLALDLASGKIVWEWQVVAGDAWNVGCMIGSPSCPENPGPDYDIGSGTMLATLPDGTQRIFVGLKSGMALAIDPDKHDKALWTNRVGRGSIQGGIQFGMSFDGKTLYVPVSDMANSFDESSKERDKAAGPIRPGLYALDPVTGKLLWSTPSPDRCNGELYCDPGILASISSIPGAVFAGHMDGMLRAYDSASGKVVWQFDTRKPVKTVSGVETKGGSMGGGGPTVYDGMLYVNSGYGMYFHLPGNMLAAFSVDGK